MHGTEHWLNWGSGRMFGLGKGKEVLSSGRGEFELLSRMWLEWRLG